MTLTEQIAAVLAEHEFDLHRVLPTCSCGWVASTRLRFDRRQHVAAHLAPLMRQAQAEAWDEGYFRGVGLTPPDGWNPYRADRIEAEA